MKKILALALAIVMMATLSVVAFAAETATKEVTADTSVTADVTYSVGSGYVVTVPSAIPFENATTTTATVSATAVSIEADQTLKVTLTSEQYRTASGEQTASFYLKAAAGNTVDYSISINSAPVASGDTVLSVAAGEATGASVKSATLNFTNVGTDIAGVYTDTLTFVVAVA